MILRTHAGGKRTRAYLPQRDPYIFMIPGVHARAKSRANAHTDTHAAALSLLFNVVCTHIVRMHAINLYGRFRGPGGGEGRRSAQNAREKFLHLTNRDREGVARLLSLFLFLSSSSPPLPVSFLPKRHGPKHTLDARSGKLPIMKRWDQDTRSNRLGIYVVLDDRPKSFEFLPNFFSCTIEWV